MKKILLALVVLGALHGRARACDNPPCDAATPAAPCPEGAVCNTAPAQVVAETPLPCPSQPCADVKMGPPENIQADDGPVGASPPADLHPVGVVPLPADIEVAPAPPKPAAPDKPKTSFREHPRHYGLGIDVGIPDVAGLNVTWRPAYWARASFGGTYNSIAPGVHGGVTLVPFAPWRHGLSFTAEAGYAFSGDINKTYGTHEAVLSDVSYYYANLHAGWEWGYERVTFFIHGGESLISTTVHNVTQQLNNDVTFTKGPNVNLWVPTFKLGFIVYFGSKS